MTTLRSLIPETGTITAEVYALTAADTLVETISLTRGTNNLSVGTGTIASATGFNFVRLIASGAGIGFGVVNITGSGTYDVLDYAAVDWGAVNNVTTTVGLSGTSVKTATDVETDTADIQSRLPAALVSGRMSSDVIAISGDTTAADNAESFFDGTGYAGTNNVIPLVTTAATATNVTTVNGLAANVITASALATDAVTEIQSGLATTANVSAVETDTQDIQTRLPAALAGGFMKSDVLAINGSTLAATITAAINGSLKTGTVDDATFSPTSTVFETDITTNSDEFTKQTLLWTGGLNTGLFVRVLSYAFANSKVKLTMSEDLPNVPVDGDTFAVTSRIE